MPCCCQPSQICLGEKAKEEMNLVDILPPASPEDKRPKPIAIASLHASVLPTVSLSLQAQDSACAARPCVGTGVAVLLGTAMQGGGVAREERPQLSPASKSACPLLCLRAWVS